MLPDDPFFTHILSSKDSQDFAAIINGEMVGEVGVTLPTTEHLYFVINQIAVDPVLRGKGLSQLIITQVQKHFAEHPVHHWKTYINKSNIAAKKVFAKLGWEEKGMEDGMVEYCIG